ncbi:hypothetical protein BD324DRAFT_242570 [Kockovaella imperatae]|uniref:C2H2-type domain-containing protein n=1 Tax=Kockovaella imperatae TaxID=4999 RepID=A0A1Y1UPH3_9TREE|nr:hypothetical protein BD324DRAFT_242570 [Kockovaella imperatae]ORX39909.1 hypothetical protein BD324DRAFT_242570 [Kockovaella imperatae]
MQVEGPGGMINPSAGVHSAYQRSSENDMTRQGSGGLPSDGMYPYPAFQPNLHSQSINLPAPFPGASSSSSSASLGMSVSPPRWVTGGNAGWGGPPPMYGGSGSYVGSIGALGTSFGQERDRELEARYVRDFACCGRQLNGLHELLEHYEEEHANLGPSARMAAVNAASHTPQNRMDSVQSASSVSTMSPAVVTPMQTSYSQNEPPTAPGMVDIEMDGPGHHSVQTAFPKSQHPRAAAVSRPSGVSISAPASPWAGAFRPQGGSTPPHCLPPSLLSSGPPHTASSTPTPEQQMKALKKAQRKVERMASRDDPSASDAEGEKKFPCPVEGCGKVYKQANGLKYHLTKSVNGHGHVNLAAMGGLAPFLSDRGPE